MQLVCKNCHSEFSGKYCNSCGQAADTGAVNLKFVYKEFKSTFIKYDEGFIFTVRQLFTRPGHFIREFIEGKRINRTKPVSFVLIVAGVYGFLYQYFDIQLPDTPASGDEIDFDTGKFNEWMGSHFALMELLILPCLTIASYLVFYFRGYNFFEHAILNCYVIGQRIIANLLIFPFLIRYSGTPALTKFNWVVIVINVFIVFWTYSQFFTGHGRLKTFFLTIVTYLILLAEIVALLYFYLYVGS